MARRQIKRPKGKSRGLFARVGIWALRIVATLFVASLLWVGLYRFFAPPGTVLMGWRAVQGETIQRDWVALSDVSPHVVTAVIAAEDAKFCRHFGFDLGEIRQALNEARAGEGLRGASTISQQTAKNTFLWPGRGPVRKVSEAYFTVLMEASWPKHRIMEVYLNVAEWGDGLFGIEAAAQVRFGKSAKFLTRTEASLLAAVLPSPNKWRVDPPGQYVRQRARTLRARMDTVAKHGFADCIFPKD